MCGEFITGLWVCNKTVITIAINKWPFRLLNAIKNNVSGYLVMDGVLIF